MTIRLLFQYVSKTRLHGKKPRLVMSSEQSNFHHNIQHNKRYFLELLHKKELRSQEMFAKIGYLNCLSTHREIYFDLTHTATQKQIPYFWLRHLCLVVLNFRMFEHFNSQLRPKFTLR